MRLSQYLLNTSRQQPAEAELPSHRLMLRTGMIRRHSAGIYSWLPLGLRVLRKVEEIVREEMLRAGAFELLMPMVQPAALWQQSGRWQEYGPELLRFSDRQDNPFCLGPTHEELITDLIRQEIDSYRQLPLNLFQIQTKFRDEIRPRFGVMRSREFVMKDAYSFHANSQSLSETYAVMKDSYQRIFRRIGLDFCVVEADSGSIGGAVSHEFQVLADSGEDAIAISDSGDYAANVELAQCLPPTEQRPPPAAELQRVATPDCDSIDAVAALLGINAEQTVKTLIAEAEDGGLIALVLRGDHRLSAVKAGRLPGVASPLRLAGAARIAAEIGVDIGSIGPVQLPIPTVVDHSALQLANFVCGANANGYHYTGVNWERDCPAPPAGDLREVQTGDPSPDGNGRLTVRRGIEVGHIFQLGQKYSAVMNAEVTDENGQLQALWMGCYGIGISRIVAAAIEQNHDADGIIWPPPIAPFQLLLVPLNQHRSPAVNELAERLYRELQEDGYEVLLDDRDERPGIKLADSELIGIPQRLVIGERALAEGMIEYRERSSQEVRRMTPEQARALVVATAGER